MNKTQKNTQNKTVSQRYELILNKSNLLFCNKFRGSFKILEIRN